MSRGNDVIKVGLVLIIFLLIYFVAYDLHWDYKISADTFPQEIIPSQGDTFLMYPEIPTWAGCWMGSQVLPGELNATVWINDHTSKSDKFVADIGGAETIMGMTTRVSIVGGDWANAPDPVHNMESAGKIYSTDDARVAHDLAVQNGANYISLPDRQLETGMYSGYANTSKFANPDYFQVVYQNDDVTIYRVLP